MNANYYINPNNDIYYHNHLLNNNFMVELRNSEYVKSLINDSFNKGYFYGVWTCIVIIILWVAMLKNVNSTPDL